MKSTSHNYDVQKAIDYINAAKFPSTGHPFSRIYPITNERLTQYQHCFENRKNMLSVIGSGEQIFSAILAGIEKIDAFDINVFAKYFFKLKIAAMQELTKDEYINFFYFEISEPNKLYQEKIRPHLSGEDLFFWDHLFSSLQWSSIRQGFYVDSDFKRNSLIKNNKYLQAGNYQELAARLKDTMIGINVGNIVNIFGLYPYLYDVIYLSNIHTYISSENLKRLLSELKTSENGLIILATFARDEHPVYLDGMDKLPYTFTEENDYILGQRKR